VATAVFIDHGVDVTDDGDEHRVACLRDRRVTHHHHVEQGHALVEPVVEMATDRDVGLVVGAARRATGPPG
jgi:hypothetical protein